MADYTVTSDVTALGIAPDGDGNGVDPLTHRRIMTGRWERAGIVPNAGTSLGQGASLAVTGRTDLKYHVEDGVAVLNRAYPFFTDGYTEAYWPGGDTPAVPAGDPSNPRLDVIWLRADDPTQGDSDNRVVLGVTTGTPASSPSEPEIPSGAQQIAVMRMPAGASNTKSAQQTGNPPYAIPYGASMGLLGRNVNNYEGPGNISDDGKDYFEQYMYVDLPSDRMVEIRYTATVCSARNDDPSRPTESATDMSCWYVGIQVDGKDVEGGGGQFQVSRAWQQVHLNVITTLSSGIHTINTRNHRVGWGENVYFIAHSDGRETYPGRTLEVWDRGVKNGYFNVGRPE